MVDECYDIHRHDASLDMTTVQKIGSCSMTRRVHDSIVMPLESKRAFMNAVPWCMELYYLCTRRKVFLEDWEVPVGVGREWHRQQLTTCGKWEHRRNLEIC